MTGTALELLGTGQPPLNECSESHSAWRNFTLTLDVCPLAPAHLHFYSITISKNRDQKKKKEKKKEKKKIAEPHCSAVLPGRSGRVGGVFSQAGSWVGRESLPPSGKPCTGSSSSPSRALLVFPGSGGAGWVPSVFSPKKEGNAQPFNDRQ